MLLDLTLQLEERRRRRRVRRLTWLCRLCWLALAANLIFALTTEYVEAALFLGAGWGLLLYFKRRTLLRLREELQ